MADKRISQLVDRGTVANSDVVPIVVSGASTTNKATISSIQTFMQGNLDLGVTSVGLSMPSAFTVTGSPVTSSGNISVIGAGTVSQYIRGDGSLADFPQGGGGGGASVSYYLNLSVSQGSIGGIAYSQMSRVPVFGAGTDTAIASNGYIASFITDAGDPALLQIPAGNWNFETFFNANSNAGSPKFYIELYKVNSGGTATLIASNSATPEDISFGTTIHAYFSALAVPTTTLTLTDRLALRYYVLNSGRTITLHTENNHLCQIITTFTTGLTALNGLTAQVQNFATGSSGTDFGISSSTSTHTFNLPTASATNRGALSSADWTTFNGKQAALNGTGFVKISGTTISYDNSTYLTTSSAASTYLPLVGGTLTGNLNGTTSIFGSAFATNQTSKIGIGFESGYGLINAWGSDASTFAGLKFQISESDGNTYDALRINPDATLFAPAGGYIGIIDSAFIKVGSASAFSQALTPPVAKFVNSANNFVKIALGQGETSPNFNDYYGIIALDNSTTLANNKLRFYLGYDDAANTHSNDQLVIQGNGNVGIGTASPGAKLEIVGTKTINQGQLFIVDSASMAANTGGMITFGGKYDTAGNITQACQISALKENATSGNASYALGFSTYLNGDSNLTERMRITSGGNTEIRSGNILNIYRTDNTRALQLYTTGSECVVDAWAATSEPLMLRSNGTQGRIVFHTNGEERMRITSGGSVGIGTTNPFNLASSLVAIVGSASTYNLLNIQDTVNANNAAFIQFINAGDVSIGGITRVAQTNAVLYSTTSDYRLKEDLQEIKGLEVLSAIKVYNYKWIDHESRMDGVLAHELAEVLPYAVHGEKDEVDEKGNDKMQGVDYGKIVPILIKAVQELKTEIDSLKNQIK